MNAHEHGIGGRQGALLACLSLTSVACVGVAPIPGDDEPLEVLDDTPDDPERTTIEHPVVPLDAPTLELDARCFDLAAVPTQVSVSPEGHLWLRTSDTTWRVLDPFGADDVQVLPPRVTALQAWSGERAFAVEASTLWDVNDEWPLPLGWPATLPAPTRLCGDPSTDANGFVVAEGLLQRDRGQWWAWTDPSGEPFDDVAWLADAAGSCLGPDGELWLGREDGEVWRITAAEATHVEALDGTEAAALVEGEGVAAILDGTLLVGDHEERWRWSFEAGPVRAVASGGASLWIATADRLYRMQNGEVHHALQGGAPIVADRIFADASGDAWVLGPRTPAHLQGSAGTACHLRPSPPVRVEGVRHLGRTAAETVEVAVRIHPTAEFSAARLDGEPLVMEPDGLGRFRAAPQPVAEGWHELEVLASGSHGATARRVRFEQRRTGELTWTADIEPLFEEHCSGAACHGSDLADGTRPELATYEAWLEREAKIIDRVVTKGDMPPFGARQDSWGLDAQLTVSEWFETGAVRGE